MTTLNTLQAFVSALSQYEDRPAIIALRKNDIETYSFARLSRLAQGLANGLAAAGVEPRAHVLILAPNRPEWIIACLALFSVAAIPVFVDAQLSDDDLRHIVNDSAARWCLTTSTLARRLTSLSPEQPLSIVLLDGEASDPRSWRAYVTAYPSPFASVVAFAHIELKTAPSRSQIVLL